MFNRFNVIAFSALLLINLVPIYFSRSRRKYAYFSTKLFAVLFACYWIMLLAYFQAFGVFNPLFRESGGPFNNAPKYDNLYSSKSIHENGSDSRLQALHNLMKLSAFQAFIVVILAGFGILWLNEKLAYYVRIIILFSALMTFCYFVLRAGMDGAVA